MSTHLLKDSAPLQNFIGGQYVPAHGAGRMPLLDPVTEDAYGELPVSDVTDVDAAGVPHHGEEGLATVRPAGGHVVSSWSERCR